MKRTTILSTTLCAVALCGTLVTGEARSEPDKPAPRPAAARPPAALLSDFAFEARVSVDKPLIVGEGPHGLRRIVPITGGSVEGPKLKGRVVSGGADWQFVRPDGTLQIEAKYTFLSDDGVPIMVTTRGVRRGPKEVLERLARGEAVDPASYYFRTSAEFEAPRDSKYAWLNGSVFVGVAERQANTAVIRFYEIK